jgi:hypothetical protein
MTEVAVRSRFRSPWAGTLLPLLIAGCAHVGSSVPRDTGYEVVVSAGEFARHGTPVSFALPAGLAASGFELVDPAGRVLPVQLSAGEATIIVDDLPAGSERRYRLRNAVSAAPGVEAVQRDGGVTFSVSGRTVFRYNGEPTPLPREGIDPVFRRGGYIHPVQTPSGRVITGDYPQNHLHHHGIWAAWTNTRFEGRTPDFWNMGQRRGTVEPVALDSVWSGPVHAGFVARHRYVDLMGTSPTVALNESWTGRVYNLEGHGRAYRVFDLELRHTTASSTPLVLPEYHYGGIGFRGRDEWDGAPNTFFLTSEGRDRSDGHATRARWVHIGGYVDGELAGIGILTHPDNFRFPEPMRIHPNEPFFNFAPSQLGEWAIRPGEPWVARYRFVVADGGPDAAELERLWRDLATPPRVTVSRGATR